MQGNGKELKAVLTFLQKNFPSYCEFSKIVEGAKLDEEKVRRLITYANDNSLTYLLIVSSDITRESRRLSGKGIDKLNSWTDADDKLII